jgi:hypothetical protein
MIKIGDVFVIPISGNRKAYGQYVCKSKSGPMIKVFNIITGEKEASLDELGIAGSLFPPVITGLNAAIRMGLWQKKGKLPVGDYSETQFISSWWDDKTGEVYHWSLWDGKQYIRLGKDLPEKYKELEYDVVWSPYDIVWRIENNEIPFPYGDMIKFGRFTPKRTD